MDRARQRLGADHLITLAAAAIQAAALALAGDIDQADTLSLDTLDRAGQRLGPDHLITLIAGSAQTAVLLFRGKSDAASLLGRETLRRAHAQLGPDHPVTRSLITMVESDEESKGGN